MYNEAVDALDEYIARRLEESLNIRPENCSTSVAALRGIQHHIASTSSPDQNMTQSNTIVAAFAMGCLVGALITGSKQDSNDKSTNNTMRRQ